MNKYRTSHPDAESLLQYTDGELPTKDSAEVRAHLEACWRCRAQVADLQDTITEYVRYEQTMLDSPPNPPAPWDDFERRLDHLISTRQIRWSRRGMKFVRALVLNRRVLATALATIAVLCFAVVELKHPRSVSAAELLQRASQQESRVVHHRQLRITSRGHSFIRAATLAAGDHSDDNSESEVRALFMEANYNWEYPLSAASFAAWRSRLTNRDDEVALEGSRDSAVYRLRTSTRSSTLEEATLMLRAKDLSIVSGTFRFRNMRLVEMTPLPEGLHPALEHTRIETQHPSVSATSPVGNQGFLKLSGSAEELRVMAALHSANIDRGDQVDLTRDARGRLIVTATGISPERRNTLRNSLSSLPNVSLHFQDDTIDLSKPAEPGSHPVLAPESNIAEPFRLQLQETLGGTAGLARFADHVLETSEAAMVQAYNLRKLAQRFPPEVEAQFDGHDRAMLAQLRQDYAQSLGVKAADLHRLLAPVLVALGAIDGRAEEPPDSPSWQRATELLFSAAQGLDRLVTALLTDGAANDAQNTIEKTNRALRQLKVDLDWYQALIREEVQRHP